MPTKDSRVLHVRVPNREADRFERWMKKRNLTLRRLIDGLLDGWFVDIINLPYRQDLVNIIEFGKGNWEDFFNHLYPLMYEGVIEYSRGKFEITEGLRNQDLDVSPLIIACAERNISAKAVIEQVTEEIRRGF